MGGNPSPEAMQTAAAKRGITLGQVNSVFARTVVTALQQKTGVTAEAPMRPPPARLRRPTSALKRPSGTLACRAITGQGPYSRSVTYHASPMRSTT